MKRLIRKDKSLIIACDFSSLAKLKELVKNTCRLNNIGGYKVGLELTLENGLGKVIRTIKDRTNKPIIYDHQKGGTDIPELGEKFAKVCWQAGVNAVILFPFGGVKTEETWIKVCQNEGLQVLIGAHMTQEGFLESEGGFIGDKEPERIFTIAAKLGVRDFVVPANKVKFVKKYQKLLERLLGKDNFTLYAPGFISQGGQISETGKVAGKSWHAIVGRAIYEATDQGKTAKRLCQQLINN